jgi:ABC-type nickel/cobalt efflux system permease component RcnA
VLVPAVGFSELLSVIWVSLGAGVFVTATFAFVVREAARAADASRSGDARAATLHGTLAVLLLILFAVILIYGVSIMLSKD